MSEAASTPAAESVAPPPVTNGTETAPVEAAKPRTIDDDLEDVLKKHNGLKYKAGGKDKSISKASDLTRMLSRIDGTESAAQEALKKEKEYSAWQAKRDGLKSMPALERAKAIAELVGGEDVAREAYEQHFLELAKRDQQMAELSPRERQLRERLEAQENEMSTYRQQMSAAKKEREHGLFVQQVQEIGARLEKVAVGALQRAKIDKNMAPQLLPFIADKMERAERLGLELDESELADQVANEHNAMGVGWLKSKAAPDLADSLEEAGVLKSLLEECAKRIRARVSGVSMAPAVVSTAPVAIKQGDSKAELLNFWRNK